MTCCAIGSPVKSMVGVSGQERRFSEVYLNGFGVGCVYKVCEEELRLQLGIIDFSTLRWWKVSARN